MKGLFSKAVKLFGISLMMAIITTPGLKWTTKQAFKDKYTTRHWPLPRNLKIKLTTFRKI